MAKSVVKFFLPEKGYGFLTIVDGIHKGKDVFVHHTQIQTEGYRTLHKDEMVSFDLYESDKGLQAHNVIPDRTNTQQMKGDKNHG